MANQHTGSKWSIYDERIKDILNENQGIDNLGVVNILDLEIEPFERQALLKYLRRNAKKITDDYEGTYEVSDAVNMPSKDVPHYWDKRNPDFSVFVKNPNFIGKEAASETINEIDFELIFKGKIEPIIINNVDPNLKADFDRAVYTDTHVGMKVNKDGYALYYGKWDKEELFKTLDVFVNEIIKKKKSNVLLLHDLGDLMDGWNALTTRGGHLLPQNMSNQEAYDNGLLFKIKMVDGLFLHYDVIECVNICDDNHGGAFTYVVNSAFKTYVELKYPGKIKVTNQRKFIDHYIKGERCFILTHGKDGESMKFGFKPKLDPVQIEKIKDYIDEYNLHQYKIEFSKGDSHQLLFDSTSSTGFEYQNFGAISPPSNWVKTNFKNTLRCFTTFNYYKDQKTQDNYIFEKQKTL
jgi:hypothetical protein